MCLPMYRPKSKQEVRRNMSAIKGRDNQTELALRKALFAEGLRFRLHVRSLAGRPDIVFVKSQIAVFVDGDFWHGRILKERGETEYVATLRTDSRGYWKKKTFERVARDLEITNSLEKAGWLVMRFWESDLKKQVTSVARQIAERVRSRSHAAENSP